MNNDVRHFLTFLIPIAMAKKCAQVTSFERSSEHGYLPPILLSIIILRVTSSTKEQQCGLSRETNSTTGGRAVHYCGFVAIVRFSLLVNPYVAVNSFLEISAGSGKSILWYTGSQRFQQ
jgi:hypothetical protein